MQRGDPEHPHHQRHAGLQRRRAACVGAVPAADQPHYLDASISGHMGETRDERLAEFCAINPSEHVVALREASLLQVSGEHIEYWSARGEGFKIFKHAETTQEFSTAAPLAELTPFHPRS